MILGGKKKIWQLESENILPMNLLQVQTKFWNFLNYKNGHIPLLPYQQRQRAFGFKLDFF